ncbi:MAG TPA: RCC1 domain-containing protein, partial [Myxococcota bacterium]|nr:RCC1 domain-containing protein [Myxococcota bacterium]
MFFLLLITACKLDDLTIYTKIVVGANSACALDERDNVHCWGLISAVAPPEQLDSISLQYFHACGLSSGIGICWGPGDSEFIQEITVVPEGEFLDVAASYDGTCWLSTTGQITCNGGDESPDMEMWGTDPVIRITGGESHYCGLTDTGAIQCWGDIVVKQELRLDEAPVPGPFSQVDAGDDANCVIDAEDKLTCWGGLDGEDVVLSDWTPEGHFRTAAAGDAFCALDLEGNAVCRFYCDKLKNKYTSIGVGPWQACATRESGGIDCWD